MDTFSFWSPFSTARNRNNRDIYPSITTSPIRCILSVRKRFAIIENFSKQTTISVENLSHNRFNWFNSRNSSMRSRKFVLPLSTDIAVFTFINENVTRHEKKYAMFHFETCPSTRKSLLSRDFRKTHDRRIARISKLVFGHLNFRSKPLPRISLARHTLARKSKKILSQLNFAVECLPSEVFVCTYYVVFTSDR